jgi:hypothetical protein
MKSKAETKQKVTLQKQRLNKAKISAINKTGNPWLEAGGDAAESQLAE